VRLTQGAQRQGRSTATDERANKLLPGWGKVMSIDWQFKEIVSRITYIYLNNTTTHPPQPTSQLTLIHTTSTLFRYRHAVLVV